MRRVLVGYTVKEGWGKRMGKTGATGATPPGKYPLQPSVSAGLGVLPLLGQQGATAVERSRMKCESAKNYKLVGISEFGSRVGETHHRAKLSDHDVDLIRSLRDDYGLTYQAIAEKFECSRSTVRDIIKCRRRWQRPDRWKKINVEPRADDRSGLPVDK